MASVKSAQEEVALPNEAGKADGNFQRSMKEMLRDDDTLRPDKVIGNSEMQARQYHARPSSASLTNVSLSSPTQSSIGYQSGHAGSAPALTTSSAVQSKFEDLRDWSISTYKVTRQLVSEKLGRASRTVDSELEDQINELKDLQHKYLRLLTLSRGLATHFQRSMQTQQGLSEAFSEMSQKNPELREEFAYNSETMKILVQNGDILLKTLNAFVSTLNTLCNKTITDTLLTVKLYETARIEYDAYREDLLAASKAPQSEAAQLRYADAQTKFSVHKDRYDRLRHDVSVKLKFLDENRVKVMHKQLMLFHTAISAYFTGNQSGLEEVLKHFNVHMKSPNSEKLSTFLEGRN